MIPRIKFLEPANDYTLKLIFDDGKQVTYDVKDDIRNIPSYHPLISVHGLFNQVQLDESRTCVFWNEDIDLPSDTLYEFGTEISS